MDYEKGRGAMLENTVESHWVNALQDLRLVADHNSVDDLIDSASDKVFAEGGIADAVPFLVEATKRARSDLSLRSAALALGLSALPGDTQALDTLVSIYRRVESHSFLAPSLLDAVGLFAVRDRVARTQLIALLMRIQSSSDGHIVGRAAAAIGRLDAVQSEPDLRTKLDEFLTTPDPFAQSEARQQIALSMLRDALISDDREILLERLVASAAAFSRAEKSEEHRPDAAAFGLLLRMIVAFLQFTDDRQMAAVEIESLASDLLRRLTDVAAHDWHGYLSDHATLLAVRVLNIADALRQGARSASEAEEWTNFSAALEGLARLHAQIRGDSTLSVVDVRLSAGFGRISETMFAASLGPLLARVVQQRRLSRIISDYELTHADQEVAVSLRALSQAAASAAFASDAAVPDHLVDPIMRLAQRTGRSMETFLTDLVDALDKGSINQWAQSVGFTASQLPIEQLDLYGDDPATDEVVRPLLRQIGAVLGDYPLAKWLRLVGVLVAMVKFTNMVRDRMPPYLRCAEDGGLGQAASEKDLQENLFEALRMTFGSQVIYELARTGGGRPDTGVAFSEAKFPIEVKHEFVSVEPGHIREHFVLQSDVYATAMDRVAFLVVLDLRDSNATGHRKRITKVRREGHNPLPTGLYHLRDGFRVETLPTDPDIPDATTKVVVIDLVPGNRPIPSSMSIYSRRPQSAQRNRTTGKTRETDLSVGQ